MAITTFKLPGHGISLGLKYPLVLTCLLGLLYIPQDYFDSNPGATIDQDPGWEDLDEKWLRPKIPRSEIRVLLEEKRDRVAKEQEEVKQGKARRKRGAPKSTDASPVTSPIQVPDQKTLKKTPKQQLLQFPKSRRTGSWGFKIDLFVFNRGMFKSK